MKKATRLDMSVHATDGGKPTARGTRRDIMDTQDNANRGDGDVVAKVMTTFQMDAALKQRVKAHCRANGLKIGEFLNQAAREKLGNDQ